jgi:hypothetical protein
MGFMSDDIYLTLKLSTICMLLYLNGMALLAQHPEWFR